MSRAPRQRGHKGEVFHASDQCDDQARQRQLQPAVQILLLRRRGRYPPGAQLRQNEPGNPGRGGAAVYAKRPGQLYLCLSGGRAHFGRSGLFRARGPAGTEIQPSRPAGDQRAADQRHGHRRRLVPFSGPKPLSRGPFHGRRQADPRPLPPGPRGRRQLCPGAAGGSAHDPARGGIQYPHGGHPAAGQKYHHCIQFVYKTGVSIPSVHTLHGRPGKPAGRGRVLPDPQGVRRVPQKAV